MLLLLFFFIIKLYARTNVFNVIKKKHGQEILKSTKQLQELTTKHHKVKMDIDFIIKCRHEDLIPTLMSVKSAIRHGTQRLRRKIARKSMESELQHKHIKK